MSDKYFYKHQVLGDVIVTVRRDARRYIARWRDDGVHLTVPAGVGISDIVGVLARMTPDLMASRHKRILYHPCYSVRMHDFTVTVMDDNSDCGIKIELLQTDRMNGYKKFAIKVGGKVDYNDPLIQKRIEKSFRRIATYMAKDILLTIAGEIASGLGVAPASIAIGRGRQRLGSCSSEGNISLSPLLMYMPDRLRRYVIMHELAHLEEMNHSPRFYALLDSYCGGNERELRRELNEYVWPINRL